MVVVWRNVWLPGSETFIRDHVAALERWRPLLLGLRRVPDGLEVRPYWAPFAREGLRRLAGAAARRVGYLGVYEPALIRHRPGLVHAHFGPDALDVLPIARRNRLPLVVTFHGYDLSNELHAPHAARYRERLAQLWDYASLLLPVSDELERRLLELGAPADKIRRHYLGMDLSLGSAQVPGARAGIVYVGRLIPRKGVADLIDAVAALPDRLRATTPVTIIGSGPEREALEERAAAVPGVDIRFLGPQSREVVAQELSRAAVFCGPSRTIRPGDIEAFGQVFLEAARAGVPSVAYRHGGVTEAVADGVTGLLAAEGDVHGLSQRLARLLDDPDLARELGAAGKRRVAERFDLRERTRILEDLYDSVVSGRPIEREDAW